VERIYSRSRFRCKGVQEPCGSRGRFYTVNLVSVEQRIFPLRGLILLQSAKGKPYAVADLKRWIRLNRIVYKTLKIDALAAGDRLHVLPELLEYAGREGVKLSLRTDCAVPPDGLTAFKEAGLFDVFLCPPTPEAAHLGAWFEAGREANLPVRLQLQAPFAKGLDAEGLAGRVAEAGVAAVNITLSDPFLERSPCRNAAESRATVDAMNALAAALDTRDVEANLLYLPLCLVRDENLVRAVNTPQFFMDHQQYTKKPYTMATRLTKHGPIVMGKVLASRLWLETVNYTPHDDRLLSWLVDHPARYARTAFWRKLTKHLRIARSVPKERDPSPEAYARELKRVRRRAAKTLGPICARCPLRRICDHASKPFKRLLPGLNVSARQGDELIVAPQHFSAKQRKYYDAIDAERRDRDEHYSALAERARIAVRTRPPDRQLGSHDYSVEHTYFDNMEGGVRWHSVLNCEKCSSPLANLAPPFTLSVTFAGGMADYIGFRLDRSCVLVCPMETFRHELTLHVEADGRYVLLRDGVPVRPAEFEGTLYLPLRLSDRIEPKISIWNIDMSIITHLVRIWEWQKETARPSHIKYSVIIVCTRYARRLQATLLSLAHQQGFDLSGLEVIIAYIPGLDAVDDVIDCIQLAFPQLRILRSAFGHQKTRAKGFMINESLKAASGEWIGLMDADTLLPPDMFAKVEALEETSHFIAPDGRKMLTQETTAKILVGEVKPWEMWDELLDSPGDYRRREAHGVPVGFCQFVRARCMKKVLYAEMDHFMYSDMQFGIEIRKHFGPETWLAGTPVIHMDHGGSHWYGTQVHR